MFEKLKIIPKELSLEERKAKALKELEEIQRLEEEERVKENERKRLEKLREPATINVGSVNASYVNYTIEPQFVELVQDEIRKVIIPKYADSVYMGNNWVKLDQWEEFEKDLLIAMPNIKFQNTQALKDPLWKIVKHEKQIVVKWNFRTNPYGNYKQLRNAENKHALFEIPGTFRSERLNGYTVPLAELWRLYDIAPDLKTKMCEWESEELQLEAKKSFEKRQRFITIHKAEDSDVDYQFIGSPNFHLRPHQRVALEFSELAEGKTLVAYSPGTGKTAIAIADAERKGAKKILVVCPGALRINWQHHILKHTGVKPLTLAGRIPSKHDMKALLVKPQPKWVVINYDILRTKKEVELDDEANKRTLRESEDRFFWVELLNLYDADYIIVDESHYMRNPSSNQSVAVRMLHSKHKMALSGTPIMNRPGELWPVLNWLYPETFTHYETFLNQYGWGREVTDPEKLRSLLTTIMIKRNRADITKDMPPINRISLSYEMPERYKKVYEKVEMGIFQKMAEMSHTGQVGTPQMINFILPKLNRMIEVCAAAKVQFTVDKAVELIDFMEGEEHNKVLIFTRFHGTCDTIARQINVARGLGEEAISFVTRTRSGFKMATLPERMELVRQFQEDPKIKFLVATKGTASEGLDITEAGAVIFNDLFWAPGHHQQCERRAFERESDLHGGDSYYLEFEETIEEWITELQGIKENTIDQVIEGKGVDFSLTNMIMERLREKFNKFGGK